MIKYINWFAVIKSYL